MKNEPSINEIYNASFIWYGDWDRDSLCLAENRLMKGEKIPEEIPYGNESLKDNNKS